MSTKSILEFRPSQEEYLLSHFKYFVNIGSLKDSTQYEPQKSSHADSSVLNTDVQHQNKPTKYKTLLAIRNLACRMQHRVTLVILEPKKIFHRNADTTNALIRLMGAKHILFSRRG
jgi:hypothetical protein